MSRNLYIATMEAQTGKSLVVLGIMELLSRRIQNLGFFRPVVRASAGRDNDIELVRTRYGLRPAYESLYAVTHEEARDMLAEGRDHELLKRIFAKYKQLEQQCDFVVCEGTDFTGRGFRVRIRHPEDRRSPHRDGHVAISHRVGSPCHKQAARNQEAAPPLLDPD